ncbi:MAG: acyl-CoA dehydrogenase [Candidatus Pelagibacterales bacterium]|jgi:citronellyl-CoA dehydrogenase|nr:MAG: acyl-CoA dehydrogenase [Pelagibacterales bacterium]
MELTTEHEELKRSALKFVEDEINPYVDEWEENEIFPAHELFKKLGDQGFLGVTKPEKYGGSGLDYSYGAVLNEALAHIKCGGVPMAIGVQTDMSTPALARFGSEEICNEFLKPSITGDLVSCLGVSEPSAGSDVAAIKTHAVKDGDDYVINGSKMWITNGTQADWMCMLANTETDNKNKHLNKSLICVPLKEDGKRAKGVTINRKLKKMGMHSSDTAEIFFDDVRVPQKNLVGEEGKGFIYQMMQFQEERLYAAIAGYTGCELAINETINYTRQRKTFGKPILDNQIVHYKLSELMTEVEALKALTWKGIEIHVNGGDCTKLASMSKLKATRLSRKVNDECLQYWGGMGYMDESPISRAYRDGRLGSIGGGSDEVMLGIISKYLDILPGKN